MQNEEHIREQISAYLDGEFSDAERLEFEARLETDADLRAEVDALRRIDALYRAWPAVAAPDDFAEQLRQRMRPGRVRFRRTALRQQRMWPAMAAAAALLIGVAFVANRLAMAPDKAQVAKVQPEEHIEYFTLDAPKKDKGKEAQPEASKPSDNALFGNARAAAPQPGAVPGVPGVGTAEGVSERLAPAPAAMAPVPEAAPAKEMPPQAAPSPAPAEAVPESAPVETYQAYTETRQRDEAVPESTPEEARRPVGGAVAAPARTADTAESSSYFSKAGAWRDIPTGAKSSVNIQDDDSADGTIPPSPPPAAPAVSEAQADKVETAETPTEPSSLDDVLWESIPTGKKSTGGGGSGGGVSFFAPPAPAPPSATDESAKREAPAAKSQSDAAARTVAGRNFTRADNTWTEQGYTGEKTRALTTESRTWKRLLKAHPELAEIPGLGPHVIFRVNEHWYELTPKS